MIINSRVLLGKIDALYAMGYFKSPDDYNLVVKEVNSMDDAIIRCWDCKHYSCRCCHLFDGLTLPAPDDFCSYAERRDEKDDKR